MSVLRPRARELPKPVRWCQRRHEEAFGSGHLGVDEVDAPFPHGSGWRFRVGSLSGDDRQGLPLAPLGAKTTSGVVGPADKVGSEQWLSEASAERAHLSASRASKPT